MLTFVGLGLWDERSVTVEGRDALRTADQVFAEFYTSKLAGATLDDIESHHDITVEVRSREGVEQEPDPILDAAASGDVVFCTAGDTMIATTHVDLRLRAHERGIETRVVHGTTAAAAAASLTGLQNYRFGKATTLPFPYAHGGRASKDASGERTESASVPDSVLDTVGANRERGLHTLCFLDIKVDHELAETDEYMAASTAAGLLTDAGRGDELGVVVARAGSPDPVVTADRLAALAERDFGDPLHLLVLPGELHYIERDALVELADAPADLADERLA
ncbi:diphthine synthase [Haloglomus salinum]|uniref:diphthine synthase n=1 Tax=Haloglomus salinum TaxID=2962673 RepID=UPI0020C949E2|nr:diphthine synthase [Haloglomus salinum]